MAESLWRRGQKRTFIWSWEDKNCWACREDLNFPITRTRLRLGLCETSPQLFRALWLQYSRPGTMSHFAATYERNLSVNITRGMPYCFINLQRNRLAALVFRRFCTRISNEFPFRSTALLNSARNWPIFPSRRDPPDSLIPTAFHEIIILQRGQHQMEKWVNPTRKSTMSFT